LATVDVVLAHDAARPCRLQTHERLGRIGALVDDLGGGVAVRGPVHLVLHGGKELLGLLRIGV
jgi:hypothetical protein